MIATLARRAAATVAVAVVAATGCGTVTQLSTRDGVADALGSLDDRSTLAVTLSLDVTPERLVALAAANGEELPSEHAELLAGSEVSLVVANPDGGALADLPEGAVADLGLVVSTPTGELVDLRLAGGDVYARLDVPRMAELAGTTVPSREELGLADLPGLAFLDVLLAGGWVAADGDELVELGRSLVPGSEEALTSPDPGVVEELRRKLGDAFDRTVTVTADGSDPRFGERILLDASPQRLLAELPGVLGGVDTPQGDAGTLVGGLLGELPPAPDEALTLEVFTRDGTATALRLDLGQFADDGSLDGLAVLVELASSDAGVAAPEGATPIDVATLAELLLMGVLA